MFDLDAFRDFREGIAKLRDGEPEDALPLLRRASQRDPENPYYLSYFGLCLAYAERQWEDAERLCHTAICRARRQAQLYLNLAEVYLGADRRQAAADTLARGLHYLPYDARLQEEFGKLAARRQPVLWFLPRANPVNRNLGMLRHRVLQHWPRRKWITVGEPSPQSTTVAS